MAKKKDGIATKADLKTKLRSMADEREPLHEAKLYRLVADHGREFPTQPNPPQIKWGVVKACFSNAFKLILGRGCEQWSGLTYCEGFAVCEGFGTIHHAWCIDEAGKVIDNTWRLAPVVYFGIPFNGKFVCRCVAESKEFGGVILTDGEWWKKLALVRKNIVKK